MTREELLELAALDAFGLLDEYDAALFTRSFHHAPTPVQDEIKRLQGELAADPSLIPVVEDPPLELRARVLAAVAAAIEREEAQLAPLATIGRARPGEAAYQPQRLRFSSAGLFWRAACFVLAAGCLVMAYAWSDAVRQGNYIAQLALQDRTQAQLNELIGPDLAEFVKHPNVKRVVLRPSTPNAPGSATVYLRENEDGPGGSVFLLATDLPAMPANQKYSLQVKINNAWQTVSGFVSNGVVSGLRLDDLTASMLASTSWQIVAPDERVVLTT